MTIRGLLFIAALMPLAELPFCGGDDDDRRRPAPVPVETLEQKLAKEYTTCADITYHDYGDTPDCQKVYDAFVRGRNRAAGWNPYASEWKMGGFSFYRPRLLWVEEKPYPLLADVAGNPRGVTYIGGGIQIVYAYPEVIEHETLHALAFAIDGGRLRDEWDIIADMGGYQPEEVTFNGGWWFPWYLIVCHGTPDDPFGVPGDRASCALPYSGPPGPF